MTLAERWKNPYSQSKILTFNSLDSQVVTVVFVIVIVNYFLGSDPCINLP